MLSKRDRGGNGSERSRDWETKMKWKLFSQKIMGNFLLKVTRTRLVDDYYYNYFIYMKIEENSELPRMWSFEYVSLSISPSVDCSVRVRFVLLYLAYIASPCTHLLLPRDGANEKALLLSSWSNIELMNMNEWWLNGFVFFGTQADIIWTFHAYGGLENKLISPLCNQNVVHAQQQQQQQSIA